MRWRKAFASTPPKHTSTLLLQKVLAHHLQCKVNGDVPVRTRKILREVLRGSGQLENGSVASRVNRLQRNGNAASLLVPNSLALSPGVQLVREWNGRAWQVEVLEDGFECNGKTYRSLSAIARMITGTQWSGPRFFGLN